MTTSSAVNQSQMSLHIVCITEKNVNMLLTQMQQQRSWKITMYPRKHMQAMWFLMLSDLSYQIGIQHEYKCFLLVRITEQPLCLQEQ